MKLSRSNSKSTKAQKNEKENLRSDEKVRAELPRNQSYELH